MNTHPWVLVRGGLIGAVMHLAVDEQPESVIATLLLIAALHLTDLINGIEAYGKARTP